jgi:hypothetical protein
METTIQPDSYQFKNYRLDGWPLQCSSELVAINSPVELLERAIRSLDRPEDAIEIELILDAISRLPLAESSLALKPTKPSQQTPPSLSPEAVSLCQVLTARSEKLLKAKGWGVSKFLAGFYLLWQDRRRLWEYESLLHANDPLFRNIKARMYELLRRSFKGIDVPLLSAPTHEGGWIAPDKLIERLKVWKEAGLEISEFDFCIAMLRLPRHSFSDLLPPPAKPGPTPGLIPDSVLNAVQFISGMDVELRDQNGPIGRTALFAREPVDPSASFNFDPKETGSISGNVFIQHGRDRNEWLIITTPYLRENLFQVAIRTAAVAMSHLASHERIIKIPFRLLLQSGAPLERKAYVLVTIGLIMSDPECFSYAREAVIIAIEEGRLDPQRLGAETKAFLHSERSKQKRLTASLADIACVSEVHADAVRQILECSLQGDTENVPNDLSGVLGLLMELHAASNTTLTNEATLTYLRSINKTGKTGKCIKALLQRSL